MSPAWHALFAPLPKDAIVKRKPVATPELVAAGKAGPIAGWESLTVELSAGASGLRHVMLTLDAEGTPISAGDWVLYRSENAEGVTNVHESVGGRLEPDGRFLGTRWRSVSFEPAGKDEAETREAEHSAPTQEDIEGIQALVREVLARSRR